MPHKLSKKNLNDRIISHKLFLGNLGVLTKYKLVSLVFHDYTIANFKVIKTFPELNINYFYLLSINKYGNLRL